MKKLVFMLMALLLLASPVYGAIQDDLLKIPVEEVRSLSCPTGQAKAFESEPAKLRILYFPKTNHIMLLDFKKDMAYLGEVALVNDEVKFTLHEALSIDEVKVKYPSACNFLEQKEL